jgi:sec-independent protein translocase protein TatA
MPPVGPTELILVLAIVVLIFGVGHLADVGGAIGRSVREFREATEDSHTSTPEAGQPKVPSICKSCGMALHDGARFCGSCGSAVAAESTDLSQMPPSPNPPTSGHP